MSGSMTRRTMLGTLVAWGGVCARFVSAQASAALPHLSEQDKLAVSFAYHADAKTVDAAKFKTYKPEQTCISCAQVQGKDGEDFRPCKIFPGKAVAAGGWCKVWIKKPAAK